MQSGSPPILSYPAAAPRPRRFRKPWGLADQALISGTNFVTMICLARGLGPAQFGQFGLVYNLLLFSNMIQSSLVTQPHNVLGQTRGDRSAYRAYTASATALQILLAAAQCVAAAAWAAVAHAQGAAYAPLAIALVPAIAAWQLQEFLRRVLYTEDRVAAAFANDLLSYGGQAVWIGILFALDRSGGARRLTGTSAMAALAATSAAGALLGVVQLRKSLAAPFSRSAWKMNWNFGRWLLGSDVLTYLSSLPIYMNLAAIWIGAAASGELKAAQTLFGPARVISFYLATVLPIRLARCLAEGGSAALDRKLRSTATAVLPPLGLFCLAIAVFSGPLLGLFGPAYASHPRTLAMYAAVAFCSYAQMVLVAALTARQVTHGVFAGSIAGAAVTLAAGIPLTIWLKLDGALLGMLFTALAATFACWRAYRRADRSAAPAAQIAPPASMAA